MSKCKNCGEQMLFIKTTSGKIMPVNEEPYYAALTGPSQETFITRQGVLLPIGSQIRQGDELFLPHRDWRKNSEKKK